MAITLYVKCLARYSINVNFPNLYMHQSLRSPNISISWRRFLSIIWKSGSDMPHTPKSISSIPYSINAFYLRFCLIVITPITQPTKQNNSNKKLCLHLCASKLFMHILRRTFIELDFNYLFCVSLI